MYPLATARVVAAEDIERALFIYKSNSNSHGIYENNPENHPSGVFPPGGWNFGYYLAGLLEASPLTTRRVSLSTKVRFGHLLKRNKSSYARSRCLDLVVWGANINTRSTVRRLTTVELNMLKLSMYQRSVIVGLLLSDG